MQNVAILILVVYITSSNGNRFNPGNTLRDCIPAINCANCRGFNRVTSFRTIDGTCNNLRKKTQGAARTALKRCLSADYVDPRRLDVPRGFPGFRRVPTAHEVSRAVFQVAQRNSNNAAALSVIFMTFGQFLDHDMGGTPHGDCELETSAAGGNATKDCSSANSFKYPCLPIKLTGTGSQCTEAGRSRPVCQNRARRQVRQQINEISSYIDASAIYSNKFEVHQSLRKLDGSGELKLTRDGLLPIARPFTDTRCNNPAGCSLSGDVRTDENIALASMHTLWVRNHNLIAQGLKQQNTWWNEEKVFQTARKINGAVFQHIVYKEYVPHLVSLSRYRGYKRRCDASILNGFSSAAFRYGHSLIPNSWEMLDKGFNRVEEPVPIQRVFFNTMLLRRDGIEFTMFGLLGNQSQRVDTTFAFGIGRRLFVPPGQSILRDLMALNINRGRDHGIPTYGRWRRFCKLRYLRTFEDLVGIMPRKAIDGFKSVYNHPNDIDLFAAGIAEIHRNGKVLGETFQCIIKNQFQRLRDGDRFYYERSRVFSRQQRVEIQKMSLAKVLCDNLKGVVSMQLKAFVVPLAGVMRRECGSIPGMNFRPWKH